MTKKFLASLLFVALLAGCASGVKLDDVPVEDKSATSSGVSTQGIGNDQNGAQTGVSGVVVDKSGSGIGPVGVAHVVYFDYDSYVIKPEFQSLIEAHSRFIKAGTNRKLMIEGHTDDRGGREYNLALGQKLIAEHRCAQCHAQKVGGNGSAIYRPSGRINNAGALRTMVERCSTELKLQLFPEEVDAIAAVLNRDHYRFK